ncbi:hypothetical protein EUBDOL_01110 [Amedibacillus dolichus DSM 3991]|uniref:Uncharacterized protein n=1 Tax=Amedibacillus dolichus DSM 3991 TaxID=428127 RepID=A8RBK0_9FIRM|nr:hypothetical protein EUBDOL_01110 [Amedibacillus dolichus DSM 3991]
MIFIYILLAFSSTYIVWLFNISISLYMKLIKKVPIIEIRSRLFHIFLPKTKKISRNIWKWCYNIYVIRYGGLT